MDKQPHTALIEKVMVALVNVERKGISLPPIQTADQIMDMDRPYVKEEATAAIRVVYEALREPSDAMLNVPLGQATGPDVTYNGKLLSRDRFESRRDLRPVIWQAMLSASPIVQEGETAIVDNGGNSDG